MKARGRVAEDEDVGNYEDNARWFAMIFQHRGRRTVSTSLPLHHANIQTDQVEVEDTHRNTKTKPVRVSAAVRNKLW